MMEKIIKASSQSQQLFCFPFPPYHFQLILNFSDSGVHIYVHIEKLHNSRGHITPQLNQGNAMQVCNNKSSSVHTEGVIFLTGVVRSAIRV